MRVALFGGSFNPPHLAHQLAITCVLTTTRPPVDELWMVPTFKHPFAKSLAPFFDRVRMCELAAVPFGARVRVSQIEAELGGDSFTLRLVKALQQRHPEHQFALVIGADLVADRERWHGWAELRTLVPFIVVGRQGNSDTGGVALPPISSTDIRARIAAQQPVDDCIAVEIVDYIRAGGLYRGGAGE
jgi:nicotinate-nucleotide adenylyltransferase